MQTRCLGGSTVKIDNPNQGEHDT